MAGHMLICGERRLDLSEPVVMGVLNVTPDSFSDGGRFQAPEAALAQARQMAADGAAIIDVGGESTRPGAEPVPEQQELDRVLPVLEALAGQVDAVLSVDTSSPTVMREAARAGAGLINDVRALRREGALEAAAETGLPVCLMHMQGEPPTMQDNPQYTDVLAEVRQFLDERIRACEQAGIAKDRLILDPGLGFGKTDAHNLRLLARLNELALEDCPVLVGFSRKGTLGRLLDRGVDERLAGSLAVAVLAAERGARIVRAHDVRETRDVLRVTQAVRNAGEPE
jgi:dihydropteroate synthase